MNRSLAQSINQRLINKSAELGRSHGELLQHFGLERFLYRLGLSRHRDHFVLKGALMLHLWQTQASRSTRDIDLLWCAEVSPEAMADVMREVCAIEAPEDALRFDTSSITATPTLHDGTHRGVRVTLMGYLDRARIRIQLDIGFGAPVIPEPRRQEYPSLLGLPAPLLLTYRRETAIAEKVAAMLRFGRDNSRLKDYYDIWVLCGRGDFEGATLAATILQTCQVCALAVVPEPVGLRSDFAEIEGKTAQWRAFVRNTHAVDAPGELAVVVSALREFPGPVLAALAAGRPFAGTWQAPGPWELP